MNWLVTLLLGIILGGLATALILYFFQAGLSAWLKGFFAESNEQVDTGKVMGTFCAVAGFLAAITVYLEFAFSGKGDMPPNITMITGVFIGQSLGGTLSVFIGRNKSGATMQSGTPPAPGSG